MAAAAPEAVAQSMDSLLEPVTDFEKMGLKPALLKGLYQYEWHKPSAVQQRMVMPALAGKDVIAQAASGTGKTSAIALILLQLVDNSKRETQALVLSPTRELAVQTTDVCMGIGSEMGVSAHACVGGKSMAEDIRRLDGGCNVVSGTPGRVYDMCRRKHLRTAGLKTLVVDEADDMLGKGFEQQVKDIYRLLPPLQILLVSATLPQNVLEMSRKFMTDPVQILVKRDELSVEGIQQFFVAVEREEWKVDTLCDMYDSMTIAHSVIFCNTRKKVEFVAKQMQQQGFAVVSMHGDMPQAERDTIMADFRSGKSRMLVSTDLWARGIDVAQVSFVLNFDVPMSREAYLHRIGRTGRFKKKGVAVTFVKKDERKLLKDIEQFYAVQIQEMPMNIGDVVA